jgi:hypothetical protein
MANTRSPQFIALMAQAQGLKMTREERMDFAEFFLRRDVTSWKNLSDEQVLRLLDGFNGHHLLNELLHQRVS